MTPALMPVSCDIESKTVPALKEQISVYSAPVTNKSDQKLLSWFGLYELLTGEAEPLPDNKSETKAKYGSYFVRGNITNGTRNDNNLGQCYLLILDIDTPLDGIPLPTPEEIHEALKDITHAVYSTATPGRSRIVFFVKTYDKEDTDRLTRAAYSFCRSRGLNFKFAGESKTKSQPWFLPQTTDCDAHQAFGQVNGTMFDPSMVDFTIDVTEQTKVNFSESIEHNPMRDFIENLKSGTIHEAAKKFAGWRVKTSNFTVSQIFDELDALIQANCSDSKKVLRWFDRERSDLETWFKQAAVIDSQEMDWQEPVKLEQPNLPNIDINDLPKTIGRMVKGVADATETPTELSLLYSIGTIATACQRSFIVEPEPGYTEQLNVYETTFLDSGNRKSSVQQMMTKPISEYEREKAKEIEPLIIEATTKQKNQEARLNALRGLYAKAKLDQLPELEKEITEIEKNPIEIPSKTQLWVQDVTPEKAAMIMAKNNECISIISAEGGIFENIGGRYSGSVPNLDLFLQAHSGDPVRVDRGSRESIYMQNPAMTIALSTQPGILTALARHASFRYQGLWARFLFAIPSSPLGHRKLQTIPLDQSIRDAFHRCVHALLSIEPPVNEYGGRQPFVIKLSPEAHRQWKAFALSVERGLADGGEFEHMRDWAGKLPGQAARIAGIFHCVENVYNRPWTLPVNEQTMNKALTLAAVLSRHALAVFDLMGTSQEVNAARKVWHWIERKKLKSFSKRDCHQALKGTFPKVSDLMPGINLLVERYYIREINQVADSGPGRKTEKYEINPSLMEAWE